MKVSVQHHKTSGALRCIAVVGSLFAFLLAPALPTAWAQEEESQAPAESQDAPAASEEPAPESNSVAKKKSKAAPAADDEQSEQPNTASEESAPTRKQTKKENTSESSAASESATVQKEESPAAEPVKPQAPIKPWQLSLEPIFKSPVGKRFEFSSDLAARDRQLLENLDYKPSGTKLRLEQIRKLIGELKKAPPKSDAYVTATLRILRLYEEQALVFGWMRIVGVSDPKYPDLGQTLKNIRRQQAQRYHDLILNFPKHPNLKQWKFNQIVARLQLGDPSVRDEAIAALKTYTGTEAREISAVGLALDATAGRLPSPFGTLEGVLQNSTDQYEGAAFKILIAEQELIKKRNAQAISMLQDVIATCKGIRRTDKEQTPSTLLQAASFMLIDAGLKNSATVNPEILQTLINNDLAEYARSYLEQFALATYQKNIATAMKYYGEAAGTGTVPDATKTKVETRMLDLTLAVNQPRMIQAAWERVISRGVQKQVSLEPAMIYTMNQSTTLFKMKMDKDSAMNMLQLHDLFVRGFPSYSSREDSAVRVVDALYQTKQFSEVIKRTEGFIVRFREKMNRIAAYGFNLKSRTQLLGLGADLKPGTSAKISGDPTLVAGYLTNADKLRSFLPAHEAEQYMYYSAYLQLLSASWQPALARYEEAFTKAAKNPLSSESAAFLLETLAQRKEYVQVEKFVRMMMKLGIIPSRDPFKNLSKQLENVTFEIAKQQFDSKQYEAAANKSISFQKEFPASTNAPLAIERAGYAFVQVGKPALALAAYELYLKLYPKMPAAKEIRWSAGEISAAAKQYGKAAEHYQVFHQLYPPEGAQRQAALKSAENFKQAGKIPEAFSGYELHLKLVKSVPEQIRVLRLISDLAMSSNSNVIALSALERLAKLVRQPDDVIQVNFNLTNVYQKLGRDELARKSALAALSAKPATADGFKIQAKARFISARFEVSSLRTRQVMNQKDLKASLQALLKDYERVKVNLLAPCEIPGVDWCALGYFEASKLAGDLSKLLAIVEPSGYLDENMVAEIKSLVAWNKDKMSSEMKSFALQAEDALSSSGLPDNETAEKVKLYVQQVKQSKGDDESSSTPAGGESGF